METIRVIAQCCLRGWPGHCCFCSLNDPDDALSCSKCIQGITAVDLLRRMEVPPKLVKPEGLLTYQLDWHAECNLRLELPRPPKCRKAPDRVNMPSSLASFDSDCVCTMFFYAAQLKHHAFEWIDRVTVRIFITWAGYNLGPCTMSYTPDLLFNMRKAKDKARRSLRSKEHGHRQLKEEEDLAVQPALTNT